MHQCGNEDKNAILDFIMKTSNPTLIPTLCQDNCKYVNLLNSVRSAMSYLISHKCLWFDVSSEPR